MENLRITDKLLLFKQRDKFSAAAWDQRGLSPSSPAVCQVLSALFDDCADTLIRAVEQQQADRQLRSILSACLDKCNKSDYDTEEREFIADLFFELSNIVGVDIKYKLNSWLHGATLATLIKISAILKGPEKVVATLSQPCHDCNARLETFILEKEQGIPDHGWEIVQCNHCGEYNMVDRGPHIKEYRYGDYKHIEYLGKDEYTEEQAGTRLEQIRHFRGKDRN